MMWGKRISLFLAALFLLSSFISSQSLVELAKKEKERREKLRDKKSIVVTNADLEDVNKRPALEVSEAEIATEETLPLEPSAENPNPDETQPSETASSNLPQENAEPVETVETLREKWEKASEYVELLTLKINALWQEFYSMDDTTTKDTIQRQISAEHLKLESAREEEQTAKEEYEQARARQN
jgi:hypothetical protein